MESDGNVFCMLSIIQVGKSLLCIITSVHRYVRYYKIFHEQAEKGFPPSADIQ